MGVLGETGREVEQRAVENRADKTVRRFEAIFDRLIANSGALTVADAIGIATQLAAAGEIAEALEELPREFDRVYERSSWGT